jgi:hypothetical protein
VAAAGAGDEDDEDDEDAEVPDDDVDTALLGGTCGFRRTTGVYGTEVATTAEGRRCGSEVDSTRVRYLDLLSGLRLAEFSLI